jgi:hypothetical protein
MNPAHLRAYMKRWSIIRAVKDACRKERVEDLSHFRLKAILDRIVRYQSR